MAAYAQAAPIQEDVLQLLARGSCTAALDAAGRAIADADASSDPQSTSPEALAQFSRIALACNRPDAPGLAEALAREQSIQEQRFGTASAAVAQVKLAQVKRAMQRNRIEEATALIQAIRDQAEYSEWPLALRARVLGQLAALNNLRADSPAALENADAAIDLARATSPLDEEILISTLRDKGFALTRMRQGAKALIPLLEADDLARKRFGAQSRERAETLRFLAYAKRDAGDFGSAIGAFEEALAITRAQSEIDQHQVAVLLLNLGQTLKLSGDSTRALARYEESLVADAQGIDPAARTRPAIVQGLANLYRDRDDNERAIKLYAQAVPLFVSAFGEHSVQLAQVLNNYGNAEGNLRHYDAAISLYERAIEIARERKSADPADYLPLANIAMMRVWQGKYLEAERSFRESIERLRGVAAGNEVGVPFAQMGLAASLWGQGRLDDAFAAAVVAEQTRQSGLRLAASHLGEEHAINFQEYQRPSLDFVLAIAAASGKREHLQRAWEMSIAARDQITALVAERLAVTRAANDDKFAPVLQAWRTASAAIARTELASDVDSARRTVAQDNLDRAERALAEAANPFVAAFETKALALIDVRRAVPAQTTLVLFVPIQPRIPSDFAKLDVAQRAPDLYAFVLTAASPAIRVVKIGDLAEATRRIDAWNAALVDPKSALASVNASGQAVRQMLWDPLNVALSNKRVLMIPSGALFRVPWSALPDGRGFLVEAGWNVHVLNHERELLSPSLPPMARLLAVADPSPGLARPGNTRDCPDAPAVMSALPGARREVEKLRTLWRQRFDDADASLMLVGENATEQRVRNAGPSADVLHFATHSIRLGGGCSVSTTRSFSLVSETPADDNSMSVAPAALALAAGDSSRSDDDGLLSAEEIATLDFSRVHWAVLAACATASGSTRHYEGLFGLSRAFRLAGARTVMMSLWPVDDEATAEWTEALYDSHFSHGTDTATSMSAAQRSILVARRKRGERVHPYYWAGFVAAGDWR